MEWTKAVESLAEHLAPYAWRDDVNSAKTRACGQCYEWYFTYAQRLRPQVVAEIGVQRGYSAMAMVMGHPAMRLLYLFDNEADGYLLAEALRQIGRCHAACGAVTELRALVLDSQTVHALPIGGLADLIHVDGLHTYTGCLHDLEMVAPQVRPGGIIVVDDLYLPDVAEAVGVFASRHPEYEYEVVPAHTTHGIFLRRSL